MLLASGIIGASESRVWTIAGVMRLSDFSRLRNAIRIAAATIEYQVH